LPDARLPRWLTTATAFVGLIGAIAGICFTEWELKEKADADRITAETNLKIASKQSEVNLEIARQQLEGHRQELNIQAQQHKDDQAALEEQRLAGIINDLFASSSSVEGKIDVLSGYIKSDHRYDDLIANAIRAKLDDPRSASEISLAFILLQKLEIPKVDFLIGANHSARSRFDDALMAEFWAHLASRMSATTTVAFDAESRDKTGMSPAHALFQLVADTEDEIANRVSTETQIGDREYLCATINVRIYSILFGDMGPNAEFHHPKKDDGIWWKGIQRKVLSPKGEGEAEIRKREELAADILERTSAMLPAALKGMGQRHAGVVNLSGCFLVHSFEWPEGRYPTIYFGAAILSSQMDFRKVEFDRSTWQSFLIHVATTHSGEYEKWQSESLSHSDSDLIFESTKDMTDWRFPENLAQILQSQFSHSRQPAPVERR